MTDNEQKKIFSKNLNMYLALNNKTQKEVADAINVSPQTFNTWCQGVALPRMGKVQLLADYFDISKSALIEVGGPTDAFQQQSAKRLLAYFNALNDAGKNKALDYTADLMHNTLYSTEPLLNAAHERTDIDVTDEMRKHDDDIMDDEDF